MDAQGTCVRRRPDTKFSRPATSLVASEGWTALMRFRAGLLVTGGAGDGLNTGPPLPGGGAMS